MAKDEQILVSVSDIGIRTGHASLRPMELTNVLWRVDSHPLQEKATIIPMELTLEHILGFRTA